ncbi:unnamed protein product, partial [Phaeothamnion confervicola]
PGAGTRSCSDSGAGAVGRDRSGSGARSRGSSGAGAVGTAGVAEGGDAGGAAGAAEGGDATDGDSEADEAHVAETSKPCPNCFSPITRSYGCNSMVCSQCRHPFCYSCLGPAHTHGACHKTVDFSALQTRARELGSEEGQRRALQRVKGLNQYNPDSEPEPRPYTRVAVGGAQAEQNRELIHRRLSGVWLQPLLEAYREVLTEVEEQRQRATLARASADAESKSRATAEMAAARRRTSTNAAIGSGGGGSSRSVSGGGGSARDSSCSASGIGGDGGAVQTMDEGDPAAPATLVDVPVAAVPSPEPPPAGGKPAVAPAAAGVAAVVPNAAAGVAAVVPNTAVAAPNGPATPEKEDAATRKAVRACLKEVKSSTLIKYLPDPCQTDHEAALQRVRLNNSPALRRLMLLIQQARDRWPLWHVLADRLTNHLERIWWHEGRGDANARTAVARTVISEMVWPAVQAEAEAAVAGQRRRLVDAIMRAWLEQLLVSTGGEGGHGGSHGKPAITDGKGKGESGASCGSGSACVGGDDPVAEKSGLGHASASRMASGSAGSTNAGDSGSSGDGSCGGINGSGGVSGKAIVNAMPKVKPKAEAQAKATAKTKPALVAPVAEAVTPALVETARRCLEQYETLAELESECQGIFDRSMANTFGGRGQRRPAPEPLGVAVGAAAELAAERWGREIVHLRLDQPLAYVPADAAAAAASAVPLPAGATPADGCAAIAAAAAAALPVCLVHGIPAGDVGGAMAAGDVSCGDGARGVPGDSGKGKAKGKVNGDESAMDVDTEGSGGCSKDTDDEPLQRQRRKRFREDDGGSGGGEVAAAEDSAAGHSNADRRHPSQRGPTLPLPSAAGAASCTAAAEAAKSTSVAAPTAAPAATVAEVEAMLNSTTPEVEMFEATAAMPAVVVEAAAAPASAAAAAAATKAAAESEEEAPPPRPRPSDAMIEEANRHEYSSEYAELVQAAKTTCQALLRSYSVLAALTVDEFYEAARRLRPLTFSGTSGGFGGGSAVSAAVAPSLLQHWREDLLEATQALQATLVEAERDVSYVLVDVMLAGQQAAAASSFLAGRGSLLDVDAACRKAQRHRAAVAAV